MSGLLRVAHSAFADHTNVMNVVRVHSTDTGQYGHTESLRRLCKKKRDAGNSRRSGAGSSGLCPCLVLGHAKGKAVGCTRCHLEVSGESQLQNRKQGLRMMMGNAKR